MKEEDKGFLFSSFCAKNILTLFENYDIIVSKYKWHMRQDMIQTLEEALKKINELDQKINN